MPKSHQIIHTTCPMDCPDTCALDVHVRDGRVDKIEGNHEHPNTAGFICNKVAQFPKRVYHQDRVLYPLRRTGPKGSAEFARISWNEAIHEIVKQFQRIANDWGSEAILPYHYGGSNGLLGEGFLDDYFFGRLGASRIEKTLCAGPTGAVATGMYGKMPGVAFEDYVFSKAILIWGANPKNSNIHLVPYLKKAKKEGCFIAVVDPSLHFSNSEIDLHLPVLPGTDLPLALAMISEWDRKGCLASDFLNSHAAGLEPLLNVARDWTIERAAKECGVSPKSIVDLANRLSELSPLVVRCGWGLERNRNGGPAVAAVLAIPALLGKFGVRGGGYTLSNSGAVKLDLQKIFGDTQWNSRKLNMSQLADHLTSDLTPPIKALYVYNCNPAVTVPDQNGVLRGLSREDLFTVVHEQVMTDTAKYADIVLPAPTFLELKEIRRSYGAYTVGGVAPAIAPLGEARTNEIVFTHLGRAMGWQDAPFQWRTEECFAKISDALTMYGKEVQEKTLREGRSHPYDFPGPTPIQFKTVFPATANGKIDLSPSALGPEGYKYQPPDRKAFPLALISPATSKMITSTMGEFNYPELFLTLNPEDANERSIGSGDSVRAFNSLGEVVCKAEVDSRVRKGVAILPKGAWMKSSRNGRTATALAPNHVSRVGGGACYNDARVDVERLKEPRHIDN